MKKLIIVIYILTTCLGCLRENERGIGQSEKLSYKETLEETARIVNSRLPAKVDELTRCDSVKVGPDKRFTFHMTVFGYSKAEIENIFNKSNQGVTFEQSLKEASAVSVILKTG